MLKKINYLIQAIIIYLFFLIGRILGINLSRKIFSFIFLNLGPLFKSEKIIKKNLKIYSQNISNTEEKEIINGMWKNYGMTFIEYIHLDKLKKNGKIKIHGEQNLTNIIKNNKPVIFISGHFANFELMSMTISKKQIPLATIYRPLNNLFLNPLMEYLRKKFICKNQIKKGINGVREAIEYIKKNFSIALMVDQRLGESERYPFFNKPAHTTTLPAQLALRFNCDIIPIHLERKQDNTFNMKIFDPIKINNFKNQDQNKKEITIKINQSIEKMILKNPKQWIWTHNRWK